MPDRQHHRHAQPKKYPYVFRISGSVLPSIIWQVVAIGLFAGVVVAISDLTRYSLEINPVLISTLGFIVSLSLSFRTQSSYSRWWEARIAWDKLTSNARNLSRIIWISGPERSEGPDAARDILLKKSAINLIGVFAVSLKNHLRNQRGHAAPDLIHLLPHIDTFSKRRQGQEPPYTDAFLDREEESVRSTWFLHQQHVHKDTPAKDTGTGPDWCQATLDAGVLPTEITYHLQSYMEHVRAANPSLQNYYAQNMSILISQMNEICSNCERIQSTIFPVAYNIVISQILWIFVVSLPFQLCSILSWATIPLCMVTSSFLFSLYYIGSEIEDPFGFDSNDLDLERYCRLIRLELDVLTSIPPAKVDTWAINNKANRPLRGVSDKSLAELATLSVAEIRTLLAEKVNQLSSEGAVEESQTTDDLDATRGEV